VSMLMQNDRITAGIWFIVEYHGSQALLPQPFLCFSVLTSFIARFLSCFSLTLSGSSICSVLGSNFTIKSDFGNPAVADLEALCVHSNHKEALPNSNDGATSERLTRSSSQTFLRHESVEEALQLPSMLVHDFFDDDRQLAKRTVLHEHL